MRMLNRNKQTIYYANYASHSETTDDYGNATGEYEITYSDPVKTAWNVNVVSSDAEVAMFGVRAVDTIVMVAPKSEMPLTETSIVWFGITPTIESDGSTNTPHNYNVIGIRPSLNFTKLYAQRVELSQYVEPEPIEPPVEGDGE